MLGAVAGFAAGGVIHGEGFDFSADLSGEEHAILHTLDKLKRKVDPGQIDWGKAGYDFGDGFKGPDPERR